MIAIGPNVRSRTTRSPATAVSSGCSYRCRYWVTYRTNATAGSITRTRSVRRESHSSLPEYATAKKKQESETSTAPTKATPNQTRFVGTSRLNNCNAYAPDQSEHPTFRLTNARTLGSSSASVRSTTV